MLPVHVVEGIVHRQPGRAPQLVGSVNRLHGTGVPPQIVMAPDQAHTPDALVHAA
jgi:hypothetical protein